MFLQAFMVNSFVFQTTIVSDHLHRLQDDGFELLIKQHHFIHSKMVLQESISKDIQWTYILFCERGGTILAWKTSTQCTSPRTLQLGIKNLR